MADPRQQDSAPGTPPPSGEQPSPSTRGERRRTLLPWGITSLLVVLTVVFLWYGATRKAPAPVIPPKVLANVEVVTVRARPYREALVLPAVLEAERVAAVAPEAGGRLGRWLVAEGATVREGQVVAELDTATLQATLRELTARETTARRNAALSSVSLRGARAGLESAEKEKASQELALRAAEADLALARTDYERTRHLVEVGVVDRATLDRARNAHEQAEVRVRLAEQGVERAKVGLRSAQVRIEEATAAISVADSGVEELAASLAALRVQLEKCRLRAPISGCLEQHLAEPGEMIAAGAILARIYEVGQMKAVLHAPDRYVPFLDPSNRAAREYVRQHRPGAVRELRASVVVPGLPKLKGGEEAGVELPAAVTRIAQAASAASNSFEVELRVGNPALALKHGVLARARIEYLTHPKAIVVPVKAVQVTDAGPRVLVLERSEGRAVARVRDIEPAAISEDEVLVLRGLQEGDDLVVSGWKGVVAGEEVNVVVDNGRGAVASAGPPTRAAGAR